MSSDDRPSAAVVGGGIAGLVAAYLLRHSHRVTLLEADERLGGHADTHDVTAPDGTALQVDSGFIVHNDRTYPVLLRLFGELEVPTRPTEMSMSITCDECGLSFAGGRGVGGLLAQPTRLLDRRYRRLLRQVPRFHRAGLAELARADAGDTTGDALTWGGFLEREGFDDYFVRHYAVPLVSCVWSSGHEDARAYPVRHLLRFLEHHGMLSVGGSPSWRTVAGGSRAYVQRVEAALREAGGEVVLGSPATRVVRHPDGVEVTTTGPSGEHTRRVDAVVLATHADVAAGLLADPSPQEAADLAAVTYSQNPTVLHTDARVLPERGRARASWNYRLSSCDQDDDEVLVSYWMNRLHRLPEVGAEYVVTLNPRGRVAESSVIARRQYAHPVFTHAAVEAAARLRGAGGPRLAFAGAHLGWGFHEDGARSGAEAAGRLGGGW